MDPQEKITLISYIEEFLKKDKYNAIYYCSGWNGSNGIYFRVKEPEDFVIDILGRMCEGRRKVYLDSYNNFKGSVYYHLCHEMQTHFKYRKKKVVEESPHYTNVVEPDIVEYNDELYYDDHNDALELEIINFIENKELKEQLLNCFDIDKEIEEWLVLEGYLSGKKREEIANDLGFTVEEVSNIRKRIERKLKKLFNINERH